MRRRIENVEIDDRFLETLRYLVKKGNFHWLIFGHFSLHMPSMSWWSVHFANLQSTLACFDYFANLYICVMKMPFHWFTAVRTGTSIPWSTKVHFHSEFTKFVMTATFHIQRVLKILHLKVFFWNTRLGLWSPSRLQLRRQNGRTERAPLYDWRSSWCLVLLGFGGGFCSMISTMVHLYNWRSLLLVFGAPGFWTRLLLKV